MLLVEGYLYVRYAQLDAEFHFWLHGLLGGALGSRGDSRAAAHLPPPPARAAYGLAMSGRVRLTVASLAASAVAALLRSAWRRPSPTDIEDLRAHARPPTHASPCVRPFRWVSPQQGTTLTATHLRPAGSHGGEPLHRAGRE